MEYKIRCSVSANVSLLLFLLLTAFSVSASASASTFLLDDLFGDRALVGRSLLQAKKACPVNFEFLNYTIITSQCKGPKYPPNLCCSALKEFACPYAEELNDLSNDCASTMFSYINLYGKYPPGLFASECREGKEGLACPASAPSQSANEKSGHIQHKPSLLLVLATSFLVLLLRFF
ncbi:hypothetical protein NMG60_11037469 [Bertholletia excelsa]